MCVSCLVRPPAEPHIPKFFARKPLKKEVMEDPGQPKQHSNHSQMMHEVVMRELTMMKTATMIMMNQML